MQLTVLVAGPGVPPGLMTWSAWSAVAGAGLRLCSSTDAPLARAVSAAGHRVEVLPELSQEALAARLDPDVATALWLAGPAEADRLAGLLAGLPATWQVEVRTSTGTDVPGARLLDLVAVMDRLRTDCPWDREQTHRTLAPYLLEETYETLEAIESGDPDHLREELGDLLLQVCFHARVAAEAGPDGFTVDDVAAGIVDKLVHRHPHVFADVDVADADEVNRNWETLKAQEKGRSSVLEGVPLALPALALADKVVGRAARVGVAPAAPSGRAEGDPGAGSATGVAAVPATGVGERLLVLVAAARAAGVDAEQALREAVHRLADAVRAVETQGRAPEPPPG